MIRRKGTQHQVRESSSWFWWSEWSWWSSTLFHHIFQEWEGKGSPSGTAWDTSFLNWAFSNIRPHGAVLQFIQDVLWSQDDLTSSNPGWRKKESKGDPQKKCDPQSSRINRGSSKWWTHLPGTHFRSTIYQNPPKKHMGKIGESIGTYGGGSSSSWGYLKIVGEKKGFIREIPNLKWMMTGGTPMT